MKTMTEKEFYAQLKGQNVPREHLAFKCPRCGSVQSAHDLIEAGAGESFDEVSKYLGFSCVGRFTDAGPPRKEKDGKPCNWTLGGLFQLHTFEVITEEGEHHPYFEPATSEEAINHMTANGVRACRKCGCTDDDCSGCIERTGEPCYWVEDDLCSGCASVQV